MIIFREFISNCTKIKRTPVISLFAALPPVITAVFLVYYMYAGYHIISDVRLFFIILQICCPIIVSIIVPVFISMDRNICNVQNSLGLTESRKDVFLGKLLFLLFLSALSMILYELCFCVGVRIFLGISTINFASFVVIFLIFIRQFIFVCITHFYCFQVWGRYFGFNRDRGNCSGRLF